MKKTKVLVIGANGFLGARIVRQSLREGWEVHGIYHQGSAAIPAGCQAYPISQFTKLPDCYDTVFLVAAKISFSHAPATIDELIKANVELPLAVVRKFRQSHLVFTSSVSVYGYHKDVITETSGFNNPDPYGLSKIAAEFILSEHPSATIVRLSSLYGRGMNPNLFIAKIISDAQTKKTITLFGSGQRLQDCLYVEDAVRLCLELGKKKLKGTYLGVYGRSYSNIEMAQIVAQQCGAGKIVHIPREEGPSYRYDNSSSRKVINFVPQYSPAQGIAQMIRELYE